MTQYRTAHLVLWATSATLISLTISSCVSSEEAGSSKKRGTPVTAEAISDSVRARVDSLARADSSRGRRGGFMSRHDTVVASVVRKTKSGRIVKPIERPENPAYTVQIGAFARTAHAFNAQKLAKDRFGDLPIFNNFEPFDKLYRVRVGKFDTRRQADSLRKAMVKQFPVDYTDAWINYISK